MMETRRIGKDDEEPSRRTKLSEDMEVLWDAEENPCGLLHAPSSSDQRQSDHTGSRCTSLFMPSCGFLDRHELVSSST